MMNVNKRRDKTVPNSLSQGSDTALGSSRRKICMPIRLSYVMTLVLVQVYKEETHSFKVIDKTASSPIVLVIIIL